jgi:hypothetical protein
MMTEEMVLAALVEWTPLIELLGWIVGGIIVVFSGALGAVWLVSNGAKRCASNAGQKAERADAIVNGLHEEVRGLRTDMTIGFKHVNDRLDRFIGGE